MLRGLLRNNYSHCNKDSSDTKPQLPFQDCFRIILEIVYLSPLDDMRKRLIDFRVLSNSQNINKAYEHMLKSDVKYRIVLDMASLKG